MREKIQDFLDEYLRYRITVENPRGVSRGVTRVSLDGAVLADDALIPLVDDGGEHQVQVVLG